jgi:hypothetical protein
MTASVDRPDRGGTLVLGGVLIVVGLLALAMTYTDIDPSRWLEGSGWTLFIIVPGALLLAAGLLVDRPAGDGLTIAGSIVTTVGLILLVMDRTGAWESWAYAWALLPAAAGGGLILRGARDRDAGRVAIGIRLAVVALVLFVIGGWYFETIFRTGEPPFVLGDAWPIVLIGIGFVVVLLGLTRGRETPAEPT